MYEYERKKGKKSSFADFQMLTRVGSVGVDASDVFAVSNMVPCIDKVLGRRERRAKPE